MRKDENGITHKYIDFYGISYEIKNGSFSFRSPFSNYLSDSSTLVGGEFQSGYLARTVGEQAIYLVTNNYKYHIGDAQTMTDCDFPRDEV